MTNLYASVGIAQIEKINKILNKKKNYFYLFKFYFEIPGIEFILPPSNCVVNNWINLIKIKRTITIVE